jgi:hypothetical protein
VVLNGVSQEYQHYWNFGRPHSGIGMDNHTPFEILKQSGILGVEKLLLFPVLILDDVIDVLRVCTKPIEFEHFAKMHPILIQKSLTCQKTKRDIEDQFSLPLNAQNLLTHYQK